MLLILRLVGHNPVLYTSYSDSDILSLVYIVSFIKIFGDSDISPLLGDLLVTFSNFCALKLKM